MTTSAYNAYCEVELPTLIYVLLHREQYQKIDADEDIHVWKASKQLSSVKNDGRQWEERCHSKVVEKGELMVVFQWFEERQIGA